MIDARLKEAQGGWPNNPQATAWFAPEGYRLFARYPSRFVALAAPGGERFRDLVLTATLQKVGGPDAGSYGVIVRGRETGESDGVSQFGHYYVFEVSDLGTFGVRRRDRDRWVDIVPGSSHGAVRVGDVNELTVRAIGDDMWFAVNGVRVASHTDTVLSEGGVGLFVGGELSEVLVEQFTVYAPRRQ